MLPTRTPFCSTLPILTLMTALLGACHAKQEFPAGADALPAETNAVTIMTFNVENLFDNVDDPNKVDETFLAIEDKQSETHIAACETIEVERWRNQCLYWDWSDDIVATKLSAIAAAILQVDDGLGADVIALQEVENKAIVERLRNEYLADAGYLPAILIEGGDARGIDVAFLSKLELAADPTLHTIPFEGSDAARVADTRGILEATFRLPGGGLLTGFSVHFPAPFHPTEMRVAAYTRLNALQAALPPDRPAFAAGDFNTTAAEDREKFMLDRFARPNWTVAHDLGCGDCKGTSYYAPTDEWSFLDMILWSPGRPTDNRSINATWRIRADSVAVANQTAEQMRDNGTPARFELPGGSGVSDHWPLVVTIETK